MSTRPLWQRRAIRRFAAAGVLVLVGLVVVLFSDGNDGKAAGVVIGGLGLVLATAFAFLEVGLSEDRERATRDEPPSEESA